MPTFRAVIFDLDGTLLDTLDDLADSANSMLQTQGFPVHPVESYRHFVGDGVRVLMERILPPDQQDPDSIDTCMRIYQQAYEERWNAKTVPYQGIPELLEGLAQRDLALTVLSNKPHGFTLKCIEHFLGEIPWRKILGMREGIAKKPDPAGALETLRELAVEPEECLYLGDTDTDMQTAVAAQVYPVGVLWGFRDKAELLTNGAKTLLEHPMELFSVDLGFENK